MKKILLLFLLPAMVWTACNNTAEGDAVENASEEAATIEDMPPPPPRPNADISVINDYVNSIQSAQGLETLERVNDIDPSLVTTYKGYFRDDNNYYITEQNKTATYNQISTFVFKDAEMVFSDHKMLTERCGHVEDICLTETRQYFKDQQVIWSESRYQKVTIKQGQGNKGLEFFGLMDSVSFKVIPNLSKSDALYEKDLEMSDRAIEELRQPPTTEEKIIILE